jgi:hypothetical protein
VFFLCFPFLMVVRESSESSHEAVRRRECFVQGSIIAEEVTRSTYVYRCVCVCSVCLSASWCGWKSEPPRSEPSQSSSHEEFRMEKRQSTIDNDVFEKIFRPLRTSWSFLFDFTLLGTFSLCPHTLSSFKNHEAWRTVLPLVALFIQLQL